MVTGILIQVLQIDDDSMSSYISFTKKCCGDDSSLAVLGFNKTPFLLRFSNSESTMLVSSGLNGIYCGGSIWGTVDKLNIKTFNCFKNLSIRC